MYWIIGDTIDRSICVYMLICTESLEIQSTDLCLYVNMHWLIGDTIDRSVFLCWYVLNHWRYNRQICVSMLICTESLEIKSTDLCFYVDMHWIIGDNIDISVFLCWYVLNHWRYNRHICVSMLICTDSLEIQSTYLCFYVDMYWIIEDKIDISVFICWFLLTHWRYNRQICVSMLIFAEWTRQLHVLWQVCWEKSLFKVIIQILINVIHWKLVCRLPSQSIHNCRKWCTSIYWMY